MNNILTLFKQNNDIEDIAKKLEGTQANLFCAGMTPNINALLVSTLYKKFNKPQSIIYVCSNEYKANILYDTLTEINGLEATNLYVTDEFMAVEAFAVSNELKAERINTILDIYKKNSKIIVTDVKSLLRPLQSFKRISNGVIKLNKGNEIDLYNVKEKLVMTGYERFASTYKQGQYSIRGEVIDIFPIGYSHPIRINISFDEIETIKVFDEKTQLTTKEELEEVTIFPLNELIMDFNYQELWDFLRKKSNSEYVDNDFEEMSSLGNYDKLLKYIKYIEEKPQYLFDYINEGGLDYIVAYDNIEEIQESYEKLVLEVYSYLEGNNKLKELSLSFYDSFEMVKTIPQKNLYLSPTKKSLSNLQLMGLYDFRGYKTINYANDLKYLVNNIKDKNYDVFITLKNDNQIDIITETLTENDIKYEINETFFEIGEGIVHIIICDNAIGYGILNEYEVITEDEIFKKAKTKKARYRSVSTTSTTINSKDDLHIGDYVVHYDYGIGKYLGLQTVDLKGVKNDYLKLQYENLELLVPVEKIKDLEKYLGAEGVVPKLTKVGTNEWEKKKQVVRKQLETIAKDLIELQIKRERLEGYKYQKDTELQKEFENDFEHEATDDQIKIVSEIKAEMEKGVLIDRLVCGDVGFGKTEIAMRIAFKTVYEGKQVAYMAPTTILTRQHYHTFKERFEKYGIKVALLNRLIPTQVQKGIIEELKKGEIDIVIGTHRLLNSEIGYKDLGLLIIDEEQRFGVTHKEKIKKLKANVNVLTLTATPIPRTLQMAVTGIRSLSLLETPPKDRYPIQTYVLEYNEPIIREAIYRELARNGQVFFLHNRVCDLEVVARKIKKMVPEAKICIGHGKMDKNELEDVVSSYIDGDYNVFVCTTIIETGIDIPNSNTLIVDDASKLGLAQMYQIRGRVGRTDRIAYAYFLYQPDKILTEASEKRLSAIKEYNRIGSGYKIAVRDLAIRGAGDILGKEQSGFINSIGIDMYMKMLNEAVNKAKGIEEKKKINYRIEVDKHVEKEYVSEDDIIIYIHKEINSIDSLEDKQKTINQLTDRFGKLSETVLNYIEERYFEALLRKMEVTVVKEEPTYVFFEIPEEYSKKLDGETVFMASIPYDSKIKIYYRGEKFEITIEKKLNDRKWIYIMNKFLEEIMIK